MNRTALMLPITIAALMGVPLAAQWVNQPTPGIPRTADGKANLSAPAPRTPDGKPDFSGLWNRLSPKYARNIAADLKPGEVLPWAEALVQERLEDLGKNYMNVLCLPLGQYSTAADSTGAEMMKIIQTPSLVVILNPDLTHRQIFLDGRALQADPFPSWMGYSVGHWEGDTLVVESNGFNDRTWLDHDGHPHTDALRMTERYRRRDFGHLDLEVTFSDPKAYTRPWTVAVRAELAPDTEMIEFVCNEGKPGFEHWIGKASDERDPRSKSPARCSPNTPARTWSSRRYWRLEPRTVEITVSEKRCLGIWTEEERSSSSPSRKRVFRGYMVSVSSSFRMARAYRLIFS